MSKNTTSVIKIIIEIDKYNDKFDSKKPENNVSETILFEGSYVQWHPLYRLYSNFALPEDPETKRLILKKYAQKYKLSILVETGTYFGDTIQSLIHQFQKLYSIELAKPLYERAKKRFSKSDKVKIYLGDSAKVLPSILKEIKKGIKKKC